MAKKRDFSQVAPKYKKQLADAFYQHCCAGLDFAQISHEMGIPEDYLLKWAKDDRKKEFGRAYEAGRTACEAYHAKFLDEMIRGKATQAALQTQFKRLQTLFPERWNVATKQDVKIEDPYNALSDDELNKRIGTLLKKESVEKKRVIIRHLKLVNAGTGEDEPGREDQDS